MRKIDEKVKAGTLTELEGKMMKWLLVSGYYAETHFSDVDVNDVSEALAWDKNKTKGVLGSLVNKEYLYTDDDSGFHIIYATEKGYQLDDNFEERWQPNGMF
jgi:hypothetical protein